MRTFVFSGVFLLGGCCTANVNILPKSDNTVLAVSKSSGESCALEKAKEKAEEYCAKKHRSFVLISEDSSYGGMDKNAKGAIQGIGAVTGHHLYMDSDEDYRVKMVFKCK